MITNINHIAIVVDDLEAGRHFWHEVLGLEIGQQRHRVADEGVDTIFFNIGSSMLELVEPFEENGVARFLKKRGSGIHHICLEVDDIEKTLNSLRTANIPLINETAKQADDDTLFAFIHPRGTGGVLVELYQLPC